MRFIFEGIMRLTYLTSKNKNATNKDLRKINDFEHLKEYQKSASKNWKYKNDKWLGLRNHISPPPIAVTESTGDCDDFASHMYQVSQDFSPLLLTYFPKKLSNAHTVTVLRPNTGEWKGYYVLMNWSKFGVFTSKQTLKWHLENRGPIISYHWAEYDYEKGRYRSVKEKNI